MSSLRLERISNYESKEQGVEFSTWKVYGKNGEVACLRGRFDGAITYVDVWTFNGWIAIVEGHPGDVADAAELAASIACGTAEDQIEYRNQVLGESASWDVKRCGEA